MISRIVFATFFGLLAGCRSVPVWPPPPAAAIDPFKFTDKTTAQSAGKTAVFCLTGDNAARRLLETRVADAMKSRGVRALEGSERFQSKQEYSANLLATLLIKDGYRSVAEVTHRGPVPKDGLPPNLRIRLVTLRDPQRASYPLTQTGFESALRTLIDSLHGPRLRNEP